MIKKIIKKILGKRPIIVKCVNEIPEKQMSGKRALVIGGGSGIGLAIARKLKEAGCDVIIAGRTVYAYDGLKSEQWDVSRITEIPEKVQQLIEKYMQIDIVVNSQGICPKVDYDQDTYNVDSEDFENVFKVNVESVYFVCQEFCKYFENNFIKGHILNIASTEGLKGCTVPYGLSKASVISLTKGFGKKMISKGIVVNGIAPGATATKMMGMDESGDLSLNYIPSKRVTLPEEIATATLLLVSDAGSQMCGQMLVVDGGESLN